MLIPRCPIQFFIRCPFVTEPPNETKANRPGGSKGREFLTSSKTLVVNTG